MSDTPPPTPPPEDGRIGAVLQGRYKILARLAAGGMGVVYRAERVGLGRPVAIKFLHANMAEQKELLQRFEREARAMSRLQHPNCVPVIDFGVEDGAPFIVLELVNGVTLRDAMDEAPIAPPRAIRLVRQILAGLAHAHEQGIVHRDVKPANVVLTQAVGAEEQAKLLDFGLAKLLEGGSNTWSTASVAVGTPSYMSPEQARGETVDARADVYAVGVVLFELLAGRKPFQADDAFETLRMHIQDPPPPLGAAKLGLPAGLDGTIAKALAKTPATRWQSAVEFSEALAAVESVLQSGPIAPLPDVTPQKPARGDEVRFPNAPPEIPPLSQPRDNDPPTQGLAPIYKVGSATAEGGSRAAENASAAAERDPAEKKLPIAKILIAVLVVAALATIAIVWRTRQSQKPSPAAAPAADAAALADAHPTDAARAIVIDAGRIDARLPDAAPADAHATDAAMIDATRPPDATISVDDATSADGPAPLGTDQ